ncbi:MAG TPA: TerC family protein [Rubricoccaceae bacterium]|jgi:predicted tellurium resistance membrane protein TerC
MFDWISQPEAWIALGTLTTLEIVLGIDNIVFISILSGRLPEAEQKRARLIGLALAMFGRIALLLSISWVMSLVDPVSWLPQLPFLSDVPAHPEDGLGTAPALLSGRDLILILGGAFLIYKSTHEIHNKLEGEDHDAKATGKPMSFGSVIFQILLLDLVFSLDSVITAIGMADDVGVMITAVVIAVGVMMVSAGSISVFIQKHPTVKMLALAFLLLIGVTLLAEGFDQHISKGYIYGAMAFSLFVEALNLRSKKPKGPPVQLNGPYVGTGPGIPMPSVERSVEGA